MRYYFVAGERSGDLHGGNLVKALKAHDSQAELRGFGGEYMQEAGVDVYVHYSEMALMGFVELVTKAGKITRFIKKCKDDILSFQPDVIILIDYGGFNGRIASFAKQKNIKVFYYIPPKVWAWYQGRAKALKNNVTRMFVILPFEKEFFRKFDWEVDYVGNPVLDAVKSFESDPAFKTKNSLHTDQPVVALLPGSRKQELQRLLPLMVDVARANKNYVFGVAAIDNFNDDKLYDEIKKLPNVKLVYNATYDLLNHARAAIVASGTATLETALFNVPQIVVYKINSLSFYAAKALVKVPFISLVNLIADREVVKELIQHNANIKTISAELQALIAESTRRKEVLDGYSEVRKRLDTGSSASEKAAKLMIRYLQD